MNGLQTASITITRTLTEDDDVIGWRTDGDARTHKIIALGMLDLVRDGLLRGTHEDDDDGADCD